MHNLLHTVENGDETICRVARADVARPGSASETSQGASMLRLSKEVELSITEAWV
jgi:hypothetical protein